MAVAVRVIPCLDVDAGRVVKGVNFTGLRDAGDPVELATAYDAQGADAVAWAARGQQLGVGEILLNSMDADGTKAGFDLEMISAVRAVVTVPVIASGGAGEVEHFPPAVAAGADAVLAASVFHFGQLRIGEVKDGLRRRGSTVR